MSEGEAFRRITTARMAKTYPAILDLVASGALHLSGLVLLRDHLTPENHAELLAEASGKSKKAIEALLAARAPRPDVPGARSEGCPTLPLPLPLRPNARARCTSAPGTENDAARARRAALGGRQQKCSGGSLRRGVGHAQCRARLTLPPRTRALR